MTAAKNLRNLNARKARVGASAIVFDADKHGAFRMLPTDVILAAARGELDLGEWARAEAANRGLGRAGEWVGFRRAEAIWGQD